MASSSLPQQALGYFEQLRNTGQSLSILVIGESGSGKTSLVNNLLGEEIAKEEEASTSPMTTFRGAVQGVSVTVYEVSGLSVENEQHQKEMQALILSAPLSFILYCFNMSETRMRQSLINTFKVFHNAGVNWNKTVIALTFADNLPVPKAQQRNPNFNKKDHFTTRLKEWKSEVYRVLTSEVGVPAETAKLIDMLSTTGDPDETLPTGKEWFSPLWSAVLPAPTKTDTQPTPPDTECTCTSKQTRPPPSVYSCTYDGKMFHFVEQPPERLICVVCQELSQEPVQANCCGKIYCASCKRKLCIERLNTTSNSCSVCISTVNDDPSSTIFKDAQAQQEIRSLVVFCPNWKHGCEKTMALSEVENHLMSESGSLFQVEDCGNHCGQTQSVIKKHMTSTHQEKRQYCPLVSSYEQVTGAHIEECPNYPLDCPNKCNAQGLTRSTVLAHHNVCPLQQVVCKYNPFGCPAVLPRKEMKEHLQTSTQDHLQIMMKKIDEQEIRLRKAEGKEARVQVLEEHVQVLEAKVQDLEATVASFATKIKSKSK